MQLLKIGLLFMPLFSLTNCSPRIEPAVAVFGSATPIFVGVNTQAVFVDADWTTILATIDLAQAHGVVYVDAMFANRTAAFMQTFQTKLGARNVKILARFDLDTPDATLSDTWLTAQQTNVINFINAANAFMPGRVIGYRPVTLDGGEWFSRPGDGSTPSQTLNSRIAQVQIALAATIKLTTGRAALVGMNAGYLFSLGDINGGGHSQFSKVLDCPDIDYIVGPYDYQNSRLLAAPFLPPGPIESAQLHGKVWITEDDTRTSLAAADAYKFSTSSADDVNLMTRNVSAAIKHNSGLYVFDLPNKGWFNSTAIWNAIDAAKAASAPVNFTTLVLIDDVALQTQPAGTIAYGILQNGTLSAGSNVHYGLKSDVTNGLIRTSDYTTIINLN